MDHVKMKPIQFFVPFDAVQRAAGAKGLDESWVPGYAFVNEVVRGEGGRALKRSAMESASKSWFEKWGNVREMHGANAAGVVRHSDWDDTGWFVAAEIVDPVAKLKCERGVYKGYSVKVQPTRAQGLDVIECEMIELSLVDRPKDPDALFSIYRSEEYDPGLAYDVELVPASDGAISSVERRSPGSTPLDSPEAMSAGSTYYGEDPIKVGICAIAQEGDRFCVFGPDGQKLGEFPSLAEARTRAEEITAAMKNEGNLDGGERPIGGPGQDQNAGPMIKLPDPAAGDEKRGEIMLSEGEPVQIVRDTGTGRYQLYRDGMSQFLHECATQEEMGAFIREAIARGKDAAPPLVVDAPILFRARPGTSMAAESWFVEAEWGSRKKTLAIYRLGEEAQKEADFLAQFCKMGGISGSKIALVEELAEKRAGATARASLENLQKLHDAAADLERAQTSATVPSRENLEGKVKKKKEGDDEDDDTDEAMEGDEGADGEPKKRKKKAAMPEEKERVLTAADLRRLADELEAREQGVTQPDAGLDPAEDEYRAAGGAAEMADRMMGEEKKDEQHGHDSPPKGYPESKTEYADPKNYKYPIDTEEHVRAALAYITKTKNASVYSAGELAAIKGRIHAAAKKYGIEIEGEDEKERAEDAAGLERIIKSEGDRWVLYSMDGSKKLGTFNSKQEAEDREREIDYFKQEKRAEGVGGAEEFFCRLARLEDENLILTTRLESAVGEIATAQGATEEAKRLLASAEEQVARLAAMPAPLTRINTPVLFPEALPRTFLANRRDGASNELDELQREVDELLKLPPTNDAGEQNSRATRMNLARTRMQQVFRE